MMASQENMSNVKPHPCSEVSFIYKRTDIKYIVICSTVNLILTTVSSVHDVHKYCNYEILFIWKEKQLIFFELHVQD